MRIPFRHYLALTTASTFFLILLGVYTGKVGAGLACDARWPLCDGWMGLFPATWPSFIEWFHRFVAMIVGFMIIGAAWMAFRRNVHKVIKYSLGFAAVLLPLQIIFGANTVLSFGVWASMVHQTAAQLIFAGLIIATVLSYAGLEGGGGGEPTLAPQSETTPSEAGD